MSVKRVLFPAFTLLSLVVALKSKDACYWKGECKYDQYGTVTPYDSVRGDLRDQVEDDGCEVVGIWSLHRHGNRNPNADVTKRISALQHVMTQRLHDPHVTRRHGKNCAQDMEDLMKWQWNSTLETSPIHLTGTGYEEVYRLGRRMYSQYQSFLKSIDEVYFRATNKQRTATSLMAFVHGMTDGTPLAKLSMGIQPSLEPDDLLRVETFGVVTQSLGLLKNYKGLKANACAEEFYVKGTKPYDNCQRYQDEVINSQLLADELAAYDSSPDYKALRDDVQERLPIDFQLTSTDVFTLYELCRYERSWSEKLRSPWCSFFTTRDLIVLEYRDDVRHYYKNGYGSWINPKLGAIVLKDMYDKLANWTEANRRTMVSYFAHDSMLDMVFSALGLYKDPEPLRGLKQNQSRLWRTSKIAALATNFIAVLSRCNEAEQIHRVRLFINEEPTPLCPEVGCTWQQFVDIFQVFSKANLDFCAKDASEPRTEFHSAAFLSGLSNTKILATSLFVLNLVLGVLPII